jgi:hypothetical protein
MKSPRCRPSRLLVIGIIALLACFATAMRAEEVLTQRYNNARTGANLRETLLTTAKVSSATFGKLWTLYADGQISAQPL